MPVFRFSEWKILDKRCPDRHAFDRGRSRALHMQQCEYGRVRKTSHRASRHFSPPRFLSTNHARWQHEMFCFSASTSCNNIRKSPSSQKPLLTKFARFEVCRRIINCITLGVSLYFIASNYFGSSIEYSSRPFAAVVLFMLAVSLFCWLLGPCCYFNPNAEHWNGTGSALTFFTPSMSTSPRKMLYSTRVMANVELLAHKGIGTCEGDYHYSSMVSVRARLQACRWRRSFTPAVQCVFVDSRGHGDSTGPYCTYGYHEKHDAMMAIDYLQARSGLSLGKIGLFGVVNGGCRRYSSCGH